MSTRPDIEPATNAVIAKVYDPATGGLLSPPETDNKVDEDEYIELKIASREDGLLLNSFFKTFVFRDMVTSLLVLTPRFYKYTSLEPKPDSAADVNDSIRFFNDFITGSDDNSPASSDDEPLNVFSFKIVLVAFTASTKV